MIVQYKVKTPNGTVAAEQLDTDFYGLSEGALDMMNFNFKRRLLLDLIHTIVRKKYGEKCEIELS